MNLNFLINLTDSLSLENVCYANSKNEIATEARKHRKINLN